MSGLELTEKVCEKKVKNLEMQMNLLLQRNQDLMMMNKMILKWNNIMFITDKTALHDFLIIGFSLDDQSLFNFALMI